MDKDLRQKFFKKIIGTSRRIIYCVAIIAVSLWIYEELLGPSLAFFLNTKVDTQINERGWEVENIGNQPPPVTSNEDLYREKTHFTFSPNKKHIAFVQNVFEEYGGDWDKYWALKLFDPEDGSEKTLLVDDTKMSSYEWFDDDTIRVFHNTGVGVRGYRDVSIYRDEPIFFKDHKKLENEFFWKADEEYIRQVREHQEAMEIYYELSIK